MTNSMKLMLPCLVLAATTGFVTTALAGKYNTVLEVGGAAPVWESLPGIDDQKHSYESVKEAQAVVVVFTCNSCPYAVDVEDRLNALRKRFDPNKVAVVAINVNKVEEDRLPAMKERAKEKGFEFTYLWDESQKIGKAFGAKFTPEFFVLNKDRKVVYMGAFDDSPTGDQVSKTYVVDAVEAVLSGGKVEIAETPPIGCLIRYERERRRRQR